MAQVNYTNQIVTNAITSGIDIAAYDRWYWDKVAYIPTKKLSPSVKIAIGAIAHEIFSQGNKLTQLTRVWYPNVADRCGLAPKGAFQDCINFLVKTSALVKDDIEERNPKTNIKFKTHVQVAFTREFIDNPVMFFTEVDTNWGGGGRVPVKCPHCQEYHSLKARTTITCTGCGSVIEELTKSRTIENEAPKPEVYTPEMRRELAKIDEMAATIVSNIEKFGEVSDIPDIVLSEMGGIKAVEAATPQQIAGVMADVEDMLEMARQATLEYNTRIAQETVSKDYWTGEE